MLGNKGSRKFYRTGGTRGGQDKFNWDDVKSDKDRENYLGHSLQAPVGRWQKGRDLQWYSRNKTTEDAKIEEEKQRMRELDGEMLNSALGIRSSKRQYSDTLDAEEMKQLMARGQLERDEEDNSERIKGLGAAPAKMHEHIERISHLEMQIQRLKEGKSEITYDNMNRLPGSSSTGTYSNTEQSRYMIPTGGNNSITANESKEEHDNSSNSSEDGSRHSKKHKKHKKSKSHKHKKDKKDEGNKEKKHKKDKKHKQ